MSKKRSIHSPPRRTTSRRRRSLFHQVHGCSASGGDARGDPFSAAGAAGAFDGAERIEDDADDAAEEAWVGAGERAIAEEAKLAEDEAAHEGSPGEINRARSFRGSFESVLPRDRRRRCPG